MNIFIDESGSFVNASQHGTWNSVAAYATPESERKIETALNKLKRKCNANVFAEIKLKHVQEHDYLDFIQDIGLLNGVLFCTATDAGCNDLDAVKDHQYHQAEAVLVHIDKVKYESGKKGVRILAEQLRSLSPQLYVQLYCQVNLIFDVVGRLIPYFVQRNPNALSIFRWKIDQKNVSKTEFEDAFEKITPALLQTMSIDKPLIMIEGFDYSPLAPYMYEKGQAPTYLKELYGLEVNSGLNIQKVLRKNLKFEDSKRSVGIQIADLLASGVRRCLRGGFKENNKAAFLLGKLMVQAIHNKPPINLIAFKERVVEEKHASDAVRNMIRSCRPMIKAANKR
ncbi:MAG: Riboflavin biosynthesis protein RibD [Nitrospirae bacterium]|nr:MAG: Riboflavin biosynthesis protein RibD [Nitrospirota bacterium]